MGMVVRSNIMALNANRQLGMNNSAVSKSLEKLSSGFKINRAGDDASGLAISEKMKAQIKGLETASANAQDGISLVQTAEGALTEVHDMLNRMVELAEKSANGTLENPDNADYDNTNSNVAGTDRAALQEEMDALATEIDRIAESTNFNKIDLLNGKLSSETPTPQALGTKKGGTEAQDATKTQVEFDVLDIYNAVRRSVAESGSTAASFTIDVFGSTVTISGTMAAMTSASDFAASLAAAITSAVSAAFGVSYGDCLTIAASGTRISVMASVAGAPGAAGTSLAGITWPAAASLSVQLNYNSAAITGAEASVAAHRGEAAKVGTGGSVSFELNADNIKKGYQVTIDGNVFTFSTTGDGSSTVTIAYGSDGEVDMKNTMLNFDAAMQSVLGASYSIQPEHDTSGDAMQTGKWTIKKFDDSMDSFTDAVVVEHKKAEGGKGLVLQIGDTNESFNKLTVNIDDMHMSALFKGAVLKSKNGDTAELVDAQSGSKSLNVSTQENAGAAVDAIKNVVNVVSTQRAKLGAVQNRLEHTINNLDVATENMSAANSRIRDTDMAKQMMDYTKMNVLTQAAQAMLAQANQQPQSVLQLLQ